MILILNWIWIWIFFALLLPTKASVFHPLWMNVDTLFQFLSLRFFPLFSWLTASTHSIIYPCTIQIHYTTFYRNQGFNPTNFWTISKTRIRIAHRPINHWHHRFFLQPICCCTVQNQEQEQENNNKNKSKNKTKRFQAEHCFRLNNCNLSTIKMHLYSNTFSI